MPTILMKYNHAYTIGFSLITEDKEGAVTGQVLREAIQARLENCSNDELIEACGMPFDSYVEEE